MRERVEADTGGFPPAWAHEPGDVLEGPVIALDHFKGNQKVPECDVAVIRDVVTNTEQSLFIRNVVLKRRWAKWGPQVGDWVCIRYIGLADDGQTKLWAMGVDRNEAEASPTPKATLADDVDKGGDAKKEGGGDIPLTKSEAEAVGF